MFYTKLSKFEVCMPQDITIKELLGVKFGFMSLPLFDAEQLECMLDALCTE